MAEQAIRERAELEAQVKYLQTQLGQLLKERRRLRQGSNSPRNQEEPVRGREEETPQGYSSSDDGISIRSPWPRREAHLDFRAVSYTHLTLPTKRIV